MNTRDIYDRIYAGFIAKAIGVRLGAPVEPTIWTLERIRKTYGEITQYLHNFRNFAADDDTKIRLADLCSDDAHCCYAYGNIVMLYVPKPPCGAFLDRFHAALEPLGGAERNGAHHVVA